ncbi:MAG: ATP-grasp domain-containing protein, partial [Elusimicrobiaceae bacterium]|nr:ATP-grasp domain-containing protein [Elusimicrobiaceae bacterium]
MCIVFLSPNFPPNYGNFCLRLKEEGARVCGIGDCDFSVLPPELRAALDWYCQVDSLYNYNDVRDAFAYLEYRFGPVARVESLNEAWLETEARLRTDFKIAGCGSDGILQVRRKSLMKEVFAAAGIDSARWEIARSVESALAFAGRVGYPVIIKPDAGVGADDTHKLNTAGEIRDFHGFRSGREYIIEEFVRGGIVTFDGLAGASGEPVFYTSHVYQQAPMDALHGQQDVFYYCVREVPPDICRAGLKLLEGFGITNGFFHFEFFRREDGGLSAMEINARPPGGMTLDMFNYSADMDC